MIGTILVLLELAQSPGPHKELLAAQEQMRQGNCAGVIGTLTPVLHADSKAGPEPFEWVSLCYQRAGQIDRANEMLRAGLRVNPNSSDLQRALGELLFHQDANSAEAGSLLASAVKQSPHDPEARHYYAQWAFLNNREQICANQEDAALRSPGLNEQALLQMYTLQALCLSHVEQPTAAKAAFARALQIDLHQPTFDPVMAYQYVEFLTGRGENDKAKQIIDQTLERSPHFGPAHLERAKSFDHEHRTAQAIDEAKEALAGEGNDDDNLRAAHVLLARSYFILGKNQEAEAEQQWVESHGKNH